ncbi:DNA polymerase III subunit gamma/tau [Candidatus Desantisbacteria bacterium]|nr:DNA polymerase III subunit gamma/tau [Candidatus Desantisbacteria bacterium]
MSYTVFARKYRPQIFEEVIGQPHISQTLINAINTGRISHSYLFCGSRGTGKTTTARILAKCLNCETGITSTPCGNCSLCMEVARGMSMDIIEIDGASNRGIDEIRDLRERVMFAPARGRYKVYIIDEVHMLTPEAFNALLKTLEEPPPHVVFIFATTEPHRLPATILSRCQRFDFRRISTQNILKQLQYICDNEGITTDSNGLLLIARAAQGGMRDAEGILDQVMSYTGGKEITKDDVLVVMGIVPENVLISITNAIINQQDNSVVEMVNALINKGVDMSQLTRDVILHLRNLLMIKIGCNEGVLDITSESKETLKEQSGQLSAEAILKAIDCLRAANEQMKYAHAQAGTILETAMVRLCRLKTEIPLSEIVEKLVQIEQRMSIEGDEDTEACRGGFQTRPKGTEEEQRDNPQPTILKPSQLTSRELSLERIIQVWTNISDMIREQRPAVASHLGCGKIVSLNDNILTIEFDSSFHKSGVDKLEYKELIEAKIHEVIGKALKIKTLLAQGQGASTDHQTKKMPPVHPDRAATTCVSSNIERVMDMFEGGRVS